jgi:heme/copper-type cytochrome/quinol oxidase subunit 2
VPDAPPAVRVALLILVAGAWLWGITDVARDDRLGRRARIAWIAAFLVLWVAAPIVWALVRFRRIQRAAAEREA